MELYILESLKDFSHYVGISQNSTKRLIQHNKGKVKSTRDKRPWIIIYTETQTNLELALIRERYFKSYKGVGEKRKIIEKFTKKIGR